MIQPVCDANKMYFALGSPAIKDVHRKKKGSDKEVGRMIQWGDKEGDGMI